MKSHSIKEMSDAIARDDGKAIKFTLATHSGGDFTFECPPEAVPVIVARLTGALEQAAKYIDPSPLRKSHAIVAGRGEVSGNLAKKTVFLRMFATPNCGIPFAMTPELAQEVSANLAAASAKVAPRDKRSLS